MTEFLIRNWPIISATMLALCSVINAATRHYSSMSPGWRRGLMLVVELLSFLTSGGTAFSGQAKLPLTLTPGPDTRASNAKTKSNKR